MRIPITEQLKAVQREIAMRERNYPRWVADGRMTKAQADHQIACMKAVAETLEPLAAAEGLPL